MTWRLVLVMVYVCLVAYSYVHLHHKYGRTHILLAVLWPIIGTALVVLKLPLVIGRHFTEDRHQIRRNER